MYLIYTVHYEYCSVAKENITKYYVELTNVRVDSMVTQLYAKKVITEKEKEMIDTLHLKSKKMEYLLDSVIIPSLANKVAIKFEGFLEVMKKSGDQMLIDMAIKLGTYIAKHKNELKKE